MHQHQHRMVPKSSLPVPARTKGAQLTLFRGPGVDS